MDLFHFRRIIRQNVDDIAQNAKRHIKIYFRLMFNQGNHIQRIDIRIAFQMNFFDGIRVPRLLQEGKKLFCDIFNIFRLYIFQQFNIRVTS